MSDHHKEHPEYGAMGVSAGYDEFQQDTTDASPSRSQSAAENTARRSGIMDDVLEKPATDVKRSVIEISAKVAEIHRIPRVENEYQHGYNVAVADIAAKIREMNNA